MNKKRFTAAFLSLAVMLSSVPAYAYQSESGAVSVQSDTIKIHDAYVNPLYENQSSQTENIAPKYKSSSDTHLSSSTIYKSIEKAALYTRQQLVMRNPKFSVAYSFDADHKLSDDELRKIDQAIMDEAMEHTGVSNEGDYLLWQYIDFNADIGGKREKTSYSLVITYTVNYRSTFEEEKAVSTRMKTVLSSLKLNGLSDAEKVRRIYDYICKNVRYDYIGTNPMRYTAYGALINNVCVCQGYSLLFYRMALEEGIDTRIISGYGQNQKHGWNIVKINGVYYNLDATWDAGRKDYIYFLKSESTFPNHHRDDKYKTSDFYTKYPMASVPIDINKIQYTDASKASPQSTYLTGITAKSKGLTAKWKKQMNNTNGYIIQYSRNSGFSKAKNVTIPSNTISSKTIYGLSSGKKYYVRICTYKTYEGKKLLSSWSSKKSVKIKK